MSKEGSRAATAMVAHLAMLLQLRISPTWGTGRSLILDPSDSDGLYLSDLCQEDPTGHAEVVVGHQTKEYRQEE